MLYVLHVHVCSTRKLCYMLPMSLSGVVLHCCPVICTQVYRAVLGLACATAMYRQLPIGSKRAVAWAKLRL